MSACFVLHIVLQGLLTCQRQQVTTKKHCYCLLPFHRLSGLFLSAPSQTAILPGRHMDVFFGGGGQVCKKESGLCHSLVQYPHREESEEGKGQHSFQVSPNIDEGNSCQVRWAGCWQVAQQGDLWEAYVLSYLERSSRPCYLFGGQCCITLTHLFKPSNDVAPRDNLWHALSLYTFCVHFTYLSEDKFLLQTCLSFI